MGDLIKYGLLAVGGYLLYTNFISPSAPVSASPAASSGGGAPPTPPPAPPAPAAGNPTTIAALKTWASGDPTFNGTYSSDQWHYGWINILKKTAVPDAIFLALFPGGTPPMTADTFVNALASKGLSGYGLGVLRPDRIPRVLPGPAAVAIGLAAQRRRAGIQNYQLRGTPMPGGMR
jgi:hypothetical protein